MIEKWDERCSAEEKSTLSVTALNYIQK